MKINLVSYMDPRVYNGGGEMISRRLLEAGLNRGHDISVSSIRPNKIEMHPSASINILVDLFNNGHSLKSLGAWRGFDKNLLENLISKPYVHLANAYVDMCNLPYLPCSGIKKSTVCEEKHKISIVDKLIIKDLGQECFSSNELIKNIYKKSLLNIYLSPLHRDITESVFGLKLSPASYILRPLIDTEQFKNKQINRDIEYLFVGVIGEAKGFQALRERYFNSDIHFIGKCALGIKLDFGTYHGHIPYEQIPDYMNRAKNFVFLPRWPEPQGRVVAEAALCGCNLICNTNVGATSFQIDLSDPRNYTNVELDFWKTIEELA